jgi:hypothetical protein
MNRHSTQTRLQALEKQHPKPARNYQLLADFAKLEVIDYPDMELVERRDTDAETFLRIRQTIARARQNHAEADRLESLIPRSDADVVERRPNEKAAAALARWTHNLAPELRRLRSASNAAIAAARARIARESAAALPDAVAPQGGPRSTSKRPRKVPDTQAA